MANLAPNLIKIIAKNAETERVEIPDIPAPIVQPPAKTPPNPISIAPVMYWIVCIGVSKLLISNRFDWRLDKNPLKTTPDIIPAPNLADTDVEAKDQNNVSVAGRVNDKLSSSIGSNSSYSM